MNYSLRPLFLVESKTNISTTLASEHLLSCDSPPLQKRPFSFGLQNKQNWHYFVFDKSMPMLIFLS